MEIRIIFIMYFVLLLSSPLLHWPLKIWRYLFTDIYLYFMHAHTVLAVQTQNTAIYGLTGRYDSFLIRTVLFGMYIKYVLILLPEEHKMS